MSNNSDPAVTPAVVPPSRFADALSRAYRTVVQFIIIDVALVVIPVINDAIDTGDPLEWNRLGLTAVRSVLGGVLAYVMRLKVPPKEVAAPSEDDAGHG